MRHDAYSDIAHCDGEESADPQESTSIHVTNATSESQQAGNVENEENQGYRCALVP